MGEPFCVPEFFRYRKNLWIRGVDGVSRFSVRNVLVTGPKKIVHESLSVSLIRVLKNFLHWKDNHEFLSKVLVSQCRKKL